MRKHLRIVLVVGLVALLALAAGAAAVSAQGPGGGKGLAGGGGQEAIAEKLGMTVDELQAALKDGKSIADLAEEQGVALKDLKAASDAARQAAMRTAIEQAVTDGKITREQADWMLEGLDKGLSGRGGWFGRGRFGLGGLGKDTSQPGLEAAAKALNLSVDEMSLQMWGGRSLADLAKKQGVELEDVQAAIEAARKEAMRAQIAAAVADGKLTQEQADWMLKGMDEGYTMGRGMPGMSGMRGMPGMTDMGSRGGRMGGPGGRMGGRGAPPAAPQDETQTDGTGARFRGGAMTESEPA